MGDYDFSADTANGGDGTDKISYAQFGNSVIVDMATQSKNAGGAQGDRFSNIENLEGSYLDDKLFGTDSANTLEGNNGDDVIDARGGADRIDGGAGADIMTGGAGADTFVLRADYNYSGSGWQADEIQDFVRGTDKLEFNRYSFGMSTLSSDTFSSGAGISVGTTATGHLHFDTSTSRLWLDLDGTGDQYEAQLVATLKGISNLTVGDFVVI